ncbi:MAG: thioredoxin domain-containing protein [Oscillospiraceae bacterium]|nr:thioredoxin domain-containing protein [Oscillospiraceae bacterium]
MSNRLKNESSPYLLAHADNPVDWYPWGDEAFEAARQQNKPLFVSIGYSSCHWCHVIAAESFSDIEVAEKINRGFIPIKVDREERPDIDAVYMSVCQSATGSGGWPLTILALPDGRPFYLTTYLNKSGMLAMLDAAETLWQTQRYSLIDASVHILENMLNGMEVFSEYSRKDELDRTCFTQLNRSYDRQWGGFGRAPKFPMPCRLLFLMDYWERNGEERALDIVEQTLIRMYRGGVFDHISGGFFRYSTDSKWMVPHFEKMLYDNAMLLWVYSRAYAITGRALFKKAAEATADYVLREMTGKSGEFYSSQDADRGGSEGAHYMLDEKELGRVFSEEDAGELCSWFCVRGSGIANLIDNPDYETVPDSVERTRADLCSRRTELRTMGRDDKVLTAWNSLMITALSKAAGYLNRDDYRAAAERACGYVMDNLFDGETLYVCSRDSLRSVPGMAEDYCFLAMALIELGRTKQARDITDKLLEHFFDRENGGLYLYADNVPPLFLRPKETADSVLPSGNSVLIQVLNALSEGSEDDSFSDALRLQRRFMEAAAARYPAGSAYAVSALTKNN